MISATPRIQVLNPLVAERIAAGEVIERPSSVIKELVENSLDAGATEIAVILEDGGKALIEVIDNGHGMGPEDLALCLERHATSKLSTLEDLEKIRTLGFRGEALPSISAVTELSLLSRAREAETAFESRRGERPKAVTFGHFLNSPHGTRLQARGLFSQVPARLKFLKSQAAEVGNAREWIERIALAHPQVGFRLVSGDRTVLNLRPQDEISRVRAILADGEDYPVLTATNDLGVDGNGPGGLHVRAHWLQGLSSPQARKLVQVVNGRAVRDRLLQQGILGPFRQALLPGQFPAVALFIDIDPAAIDVNVHPTKTEVRFLESRKIFLAVEKVIDSLIARNGAPSYPTGSMNFAAGEPLASGTRDAGASLTDRAPSSWGAAEPQGFPQSPTIAASPRFQEAMNFRATPTLSTDSSGSTAPLTHHPFEGGRLAGLIFQTYILYDLGNELVLIDQHAADERIRYERLRKRALQTGENQAVSPQALLLPEAVRFDSGARAELESRLGWIERLGFEAEIFGEDTLLFRAIPAEWGSSELRTRLKNLVERVLATPADQARGQLLMDETLFESLASEACHSAVRAGDRLEDAEAQTLVRQLFECEHPWNCPHGRPTVVRVPRSKLEEWFQRRV